MTDVYIGIDPGRNGGIVVLDVRGRVVSAGKMPTTPKDVWDAVREWRTQPGFVSAAAVEKVSGYVGEQQPGSAAFVFGCGVGGLMMALIGNGIPYVQVFPQAWQKAMGISPRKKATGTVKVVAQKGKNKGKMVEKKIGGESKTEFKNRIRRRAQELFPAQTITLQTADAFLIAEHLRQTRGKK
ncbi:MAG: hypothetical protein ACRC7O_06215 [Fimbriiglobus sp.]